jgi:hypothetical protein
MSTEPELSLVPRAQMVQVLRKQTYYPQVRRLVNLAALAFIVVFFIMFLWTLAKGGASFAAFGFLASLYPTLIVVVVRPVILVVLDIADGVVELRLQGRRGPAGGE